MMAARSFQLVLVSFAFFGATADIWSCDIAVHGLGPTISGLWMYKNGMYLPGDIRNRYEQYEPMPPKGSNPSLEFNMEKGYYKKFNGDAWLFVNYNISKFGSSSDDAEIMARCTSAACLNTTDISKLPTGEGWEVATKKCLCGEKSCDASACAFQDVGESVSIGCCEEKPEVARCDSWTWDQCEKLTPSIWHGNHC